MIIEEYPYKGREDRIKHHSDTHTIIQVETGVEYGEAVDIYPCPYTYVESENPLEPEEEATEQDYRDSLNRLGVDV